MGDREYIKNADGTDAKNADGDRLFYSTKDGDSHNDQKVYSEQRGFGGGSTKEDVKYDPDKQEFKD